MKYRWRRNILSGCLFAMLLFVSAAVAGEADRTQILLLNSYHQRMPWVADIVTGVEDVIKPEKNDYSLYVENMDSKEFHSEEYFAKFREYLTVKYANTDLDLIFSSDNNAYDFLRSHRDDLFPGVPVVFCGVNNFDDEQLFGFEDFTGVAEIFSARETIELALQLQPEVSRVYVINDYLKTGRLWARDIELALAELEQTKNLSVEYSENITRDELLEKVAGFEEDTVVLLGAYFSDKNKEPVRYEQIASLLSRASSVPVYCLVEFVIDEGLMGGQVISSYFQGYSMAQIGLNLIIGADPSTMPVMLKGSNRPIVNYEQFTRFGLDDANLTDAIRIINKPYSFYEDYKREIRIVSGSFLALVVAIMALVFNTHRLRKAEAALRGSEEQLRQLANATWEAVFIHDNGILLQVNELFTNIFGFEPDELLGKPFLQHIYTEESYKEALKRLKSGTLGLFEAEGKRKDGTSFPLEARVRNMEYQGRKVRVLAIRDLTERKDMEGQLAQSQKLEAMGTLAGGIAHDFNNILSAIIGYSELTMLSLPQDTVAGKNVNHILNAGNRAKALVQQILTFAHKSEQKQEPVQMALVVQEVTKLLRASMPTSIEINTDLSSSSFVLSDTTNIHQVIMNLCTNAGKAMMDGGILKVSLKDITIDEWFVVRYPDITEGRYVRLTIEDTGTGIPEDIRSRIFDPFFTTRSKEDGTGLGLSVVHGIVKDAGGLVTVQSEPDVGTRFDVYLPVLQNMANGTTEITENLPCGTESVMLVDDESALVEVGQEILSSLGYAVETFIDPDDALDAFYASPDRFDLIISDMTMPRMGGDRLAAQMLSVRPDIPIIIYTGYSERFSEQEAITLGVKKFIFKPVDIATLAVTIREVLDESLPGLPKSQDK